MNKKIFFLLLLIFLIGVFIIKILQQKDLVLNIFKHFFCFNLAKSSGVLLLLSTIFLSAPALNNLLII